MPDKIVLVEEGLLKGRIFRSINGREYVSFSRVPYAEPPVQKLRFKDSIPVRPWRGIRDASEESNACPQINIMTRQYLGNEDCLHLNIVTSSLTANKAVLAWIHGGGFTTGSNNFDLYSPDYLINKDIVYVAINYRLGPLGFLNMNSKDCPGNQGLKDLVLALKWIKRNIVSFGGDSRNITIMGGSAGSACVHYLCLSPLAKGLFHKAILQSGVATNPWAFSRENKCCGYELAEELGEDCVSAEEVIDYLRTLPAKSIVEAWEKLHPKFMYYFQFSFCPTIDDKSEIPFLTEAPETLVARGVKVPIMIGYNSHEGIACFVHDRTDIIKKYNSHFAKTLILELKNKNPIDVARISRDIRHFYFGNLEISNNTLDYLVQLFSEVQFVNNIHQVVEIQRRTTNFPIYLYKFTYTPNHTLKKFYQIMLSGTCHVDELACLFYSPVLSGGQQFPRGSKDYEMAERMSTMWTNFAKTGNPNLNDNDVTTVWLPVTMREKNYLEIGPNNIPGCDPDKEKWQLWRSLYPH